MTPARECRHGGKAFFQSGISWDVRILRCLRCMKLLPIGPSNDEPDAVAIEIIAAHFVSIEKTNPSWHMLADLGELITDGFVPPHLEAAMLAREIATHEGAEEL